MEDIIKQLVEDLECIKDFNDMSFKSNEKEIKFYTYSQNHIIALREQNSYISGENAIIDYVLEKLKTRMLLLKKFRK